MKIVITGGAGFIGSHLVEKLIESCDLHVIDNLSTGHFENIKKFQEKISFHNFDIHSSNEDTIDKVVKGSDIVFHLAALADIVPSMQYPEKYYNSNVTGTLKLLQSMVRNNVSKIIYTASSSCYGVPDKFPTDENAEERPQYPYALTKLLGEKIIFHWSHIYKINAISLRQLTF